MNFRYFIYAFILILITIICYYFTPSSIFMEMDVPQISEIKYFEKPYLYLGVNIFTIFFPLILSFDKKVAYYKEWKHLFPAIFIVGLFFIIWDIIFTHFQVWGFNPNYYLEFTKTAGLPLSEYLFFITVPYACVFIYACLKAYFKKAFLENFKEYTLLLCIAFFIIISIIFYNKIYTSVTALLNLLILSYLYFNKKYDVWKWFFPAYIISLIPFLLVDGILTGGFSQEPVVIYNSFGFSGIRIVSIPFEDAMYGFLLILMNIQLYEYFKNK